MPPKNHPFLKPNARSSQGRRSQVAPTPPAPSSRSSISSIGINSYEIDPQVSNNIQDDLDRATDDAQSTQSPISQLQPQLESEVESSLLEDCCSTYTESQTRAQTPYTDSVLLDPEDDNDHPLPPNIYTETATPSTKSDRSRSAMCWKYMPGPPHTIYKLRTGDPKDIYWVCKFCSRYWKKSGGTSHMKHHLEREHNIKDMDAIQKKGAVQVTTEATLAHAHDYPQKRRRKQDDEFSMDVFEGYFVRWVTRCGIAFVHVRRQEFRDMMEYASRHLDDGLPRSDSTVRD